jgi:hypothetical protein
MWSFSQDVLSERSTKLDTILPSVQKPGNSWTTDHDTRAQPLVIYSSNSLFMICCALNIAESSTTRASSSPSSNSRIELLPSSLGMNIFAIRSDEVNNAQVWKACPFTWWRNDPTFERLTLAVACFPGHAHFLDQALASTRLRGPRKP